MTVQMNSGNQEFDQPANAILDSSQPRPDVDQHGDWEEWTRRRLRQIYRAGARATLQRGWDLLGDDHLARLRWLIGSGFFGDIEVLVREAEEQRDKENALVSTYGLTDSDFRSMLSEGLFAALRKGSDHPFAAAIRALFHEMPDEGLPGHPQIRHGSHHRAAPESRGCPTGRKGLTMRRTMRAAIALSALALAVLAAACSSASTYHPVTAASSAAAPIVSSTFSQAQLATLESELTAAFQQQVTAHPGYPVTDVSAAVHQVFPKGDTGKIVAFAEKKFIPGVLTSKGPGSARDLWVKAVVAYAVTSGGASAAPSLPAASIPGTSVSSSAPPTAVSPSP